MVFVPDYTGTNNTWLAGGVEHDAHAVFYLSQPFGILSL